MHINCFDQTGRLPVKSEKIVKILKQIITVENKLIDGQINIVFVDNDYIHKLNVQYLSHDYPTDVISFPIEEDEDYIEGEIYVSLDQAEKQADLYQATFSAEIWRLLIHGVLHLLGYRDQSKEEKKTMTDKENFYLIKYGLTERAIV